MIGKFILDQLISFIVGGVVVPLIVFLINLYLPNDKVKAFGRKVGRIATKYFRQKLGRPYEEVESKFQGTLAAFIEGINEGLDVDEVD